MSSAAGPQVQYTTYYTQRFQGEDGNRVLYFLQDDSKTTTTLAVAGHDPRGTGHFTYISTPEMQGVAPALKCTNRCGLLLRRQLKLSLTFSPITVLVKMPCTGLFKISKDLLVASAYFLELGS